MRAIYITEFAQPPRLEIREVPAPSIREGSQVLVKVAAAGLNRADLLQAAGHYPPPAGYSPNIPGLEFAGEIVEIGENVTRWRIGDRVFGITPGEAQSEFVVTDQAELAGIPDALDFTDAAAVPEAFMTAYDAVFSQGELPEGGTLLIQAVASGVGLAALQLAKASNSTVIGTSRTPAKLDRCAEFGLDHAIATDGSDFAERVLDATKGRGADVILDLVGGKYLEQNLKSLAPRGRLMLVGLTSGRSGTFDLGLALQKRATIIGTTMRARGSAEQAAVTKAFVDAVLPLLTSGRIRPNVDRIFPFDDAPAAYSYLASNESFGKVVVDFLPK